MTLEDSTATDPMHDFKYGPIQEGPTFVKPDIDWFHADIHAKQVADERVTNRARALMFVAASFMLGSIGYTFLKIGLAL